MGMGLEDDVYNVKEVGLEITGAWSQNFIVLENMDKDIVTWLPVDNLRLLQHKAEPDKCVIGCDGAWYTCNQNLEFVAKQIYASRESFASMWEESRMK